MCHIRRKGGGEGGRVHAIHSLFLCSYYHCTGEGRKALLAPAISSSFNNEYMRAGGREESRGDHPIFTLFNKLQEEGGSLIARRRRTYITCITQHGKQDTATYALGCK